MVSKQFPASRASAQTFAIGGVFLVLLVAWTFTNFWTHPEALLNWRFLTHDLANQLHLNDELLAGKRLYADAFSQYGPASANANLLVASLFGNTARNFMLCQGCFAIVCVLQAYALLRRNAKAGWAIVWTAVAILPWLPSTAGGPGAYLQPYGGLERIVLLAIALSWRPITGRSIKRNLALGLLLGCLPWIKFGSAFVAGAALLVADVIVLISRREFHSLRFKAIVRAFAWVLCGFLIGQGALVIYAFVALPAPIAKDVLWPFFILGAYSGYVTSDIRFLHWLNRGYFLGAQLPIAAALASACLVTWRLFAGSHATVRDDAASSHEDSAGGFVFLLLFWLIGLAGYLAHVWLIMGYAWLLMPAAAYALTFLRPRLHLAALCLWLPCFGLTARALLPGPTADGSKPVQFRNGETLWLDETWQKRVPILSDVLKEQCGPPERPSRGIMAFPTAGGIAHYFGYPPLTRQSWFMPGFVRPYDEDTIRESLPRTGALIVFLEKPIAPQFSSNANNWGFGPVFSPKLAAEISAAFGEPLQVDTLCWVSRSRPGPSAR